MSLSTTALTALFLQQSFLDSQEDYKRTLTSTKLPRWDAVVLTASNELQAEGYQKQLDLRKKQNRLPLETEFIVVPDKDNVRVGSAGSTLSVIRILHNKYGNLDGKRFLCIHAGGNSSRCPQYSALGKLFSPLPMELNGSPATLFDMFLVTLSSMPGRINDGMLLLSGDVVLLFNPLMCDFGSADAAVISFKESAETGKDHGVYVKSSTGNVKKFLHKQTIERLKNEAAVDDHGMCSIDTGAIWLSPEILDKLYDLVAEDNDYDSLVNDRVRLSLYSDIAYCLAEDSTLMSFYKETPEGEFCAELTDARTKLWNAIGSYNMKLLNLTPAKFVHFGSIPEILKLMDTGVSEYELLGWKKQICSSADDSNVAAYNSVLNNSAIIGNGCYIEASYVHDGAEIGDGTYLSYIDIHSHDVIPSNVLIHGLKQINGKFVCQIMGTTDNPKNNNIFGMDICEILRKNEINENTVWDDNTAHTLWNAKLYPECNTIEEAVKDALDVYDVFTGSNQNIENWINKPRKSLCSGFNDADPQAIIDWTQRMTELVRMGEIEKLIKTGGKASEAKTILQSDKLTKIQKQWLKNTMDGLDLTNLSDLSFAMRLYLYLGIGLNDEKFIAQYQKTVADSILKRTFDRLSINNQAHITCDEITVRLPLRVNWGGGWSDTAPYCIENGGTVLNAAIKLDGELPVEVHIKRITEKKIVFDSRDMDVHGEFNTTEQLQNTGDPFDPFALQKACLLACGIIPVKGGNLDCILERLDGGFEINSEVHNVPKGSGLGTSSILAACTVKAVFEFMGIAYTDDTVYSTVLTMEQIMSTGGGWQDQVGGLVEGIKLISSEPGIEQKLQVEKIQPSEAIKNELNDRFCLIYTGQRRLARNLLRDVMMRYSSGETDSLNGLERIQELAALMKKALEQDSIDEFARLLNEHWYWSKMIDSGTSNTLIEQILLSIDDMIDAKMICGAGGGGFLQVILKKDITKNDIHKRLKEVFQDFNVDVWNMEFVWQ